MSLKQQHSARPIEPELALAAACCAWPTTAAPRALVRERAEWVNDWDRFAHLVDVHRIAPLAHRSLAEAGVTVPPALADELQRKSREAARFDLRLAAESLRLQRAFEEAGLALLILKGVAAGMLAYGRLGMKMSWDIDILIDGLRAEESRRLLSTLGYRPVFDEGQCAAIGEIAHELTFRHANGIELDVHTRLCANPHALPAIGAHGPSQKVRIAGGEIAALADEPLFAYLCYHGATHHWSRLKWLADFNAFASSRREHLELLLSAARKYGVGRSASNALKLASELFGTLWPEPVERQLENSWIARRLRANVVSSAPFRGVSASRSWRSWLLQFGIETDSRHVATHFTTRWQSTIDRATLRLPRRLEFVYHIVRIPMFVWRSIQRMTGPLRSGVAESNG